ncbi:hypothetical protein JK386_00205 [Nocardioides sp. zg-536]|uniref:Copper chaperone PCu(A)C n=1 Tax=Nocardioides faecalis TaxID=2803858 RepID=A0A939BR71_9ACTN|nr:hypothetical protein [Nocardioides faecalis]MBM9458319.1 hypothetical protein [Nocardioides faecalis]MBS4753380.1 hypothetical protein [Nocardioides faecalis]QVI58345.1 hypothetical protein KG111_15285 [Nocardioides faecalis]
MHHLRPTAIAGVLLAASLTLTSCGFQYQTDRVNTIAAGVNVRDADVEALGLRILATQPGTGKLIGALANNTGEDVALESVGSPEDSLTSDFEPVEVGKDGTINLAQDASVEVNGDFTAGNFVDIILTFSNGEVISVGVPVVKRCYEYTEVPELDANQGDGAEAAAEEDGTAADEDGAGLHEEGGDATFNCAADAPSPEGGH